METEVRGCTVLVMDLARQLGLEDCGMIGDSDKLLLRLMMPVAKMYTAKKAVANASEGLECFGGQVLNFHIIFFFRKCKNARVTLGIKV